MPSQELIVKYEVSPPFAGLRVDVFLRARIKRISRSRIRQIIECGDCFFEGRKGISPSTRVAAGDVLVLRRELRDEVHVPQSYNTVYEDARILIVDKPPGLPVHPTSRYLKSNLINLLKQNYADAPRLCHRIDRETSGLVLLAMDAEADRCLKRQFMTRMVHKSYLALVKGHPRPPEGIVDVPLRRGRISRVEMKMEVVGAKEAQDPLHPPKSAVTRYRTVGISRRFALVECFPETGRQHQIRVHMEHIGHPLVGDKLYGVGEEVFLEFIRNGMTARIAAQLLLPRHALHSYTLSFLHPNDGRRMEFRADLPQDMKDLFEGDK